MGNIPEKCCCTRGRMIATAWIHICSTRQIRRSQQSGPRTLSANQPGDRLRTQIRHTDKTNTHQIHRDRGASTGSSLIRHAYETLYVLPVGYQDVTHPCLCGQWSCPAASSHHPRRLRSPYPRGRRRKRRHRRTSPRRRCSSCERRPRDRMRVD